MNQFSSVHITKFLPHRPPFLLVDYLSYLDDNSVKTTYKIPVDSIFLEKDYFSEVGLIECAAQTCSTIVGRTYFLEEDKSDDIRLVGYISSVKKAKILALAKAGDSIEISAKLLSNFITDDYQLCTMNCEIFKEQIKLLSCELNLIIQEVK